MIDEIVITLLFSNVFNEFERFGFRILFCSYYYEWWFIVKSCLYKKKGFDPLNVKKVKRMSAYNFQATIASRGYHAYEETTWSNAKVSEKVKIEIETNQSSIAIYPYACAVKAKEKYFAGWKTVGHGPREISQYIYFFVKKENGKITGNYKPSPNPSAGLEIPLQLTFSCPLE